MQAYTCLVYLSVLLVFSKTVINSFVFHTIDSNLLEILYDDWLLKHP